MVAGSTSGHDLLVEQTARALERLAKDAPTNVQAHARLLHTDDKGRALVAARHHAYWAYMLEAPYVHNDERYRWLCVVAPPGYAKSTWGTMVGSTWVLGTRPADRIGLISNTATQAEAFAGAIRDVVEQPRFAATYGVRPDYKRGWRTNEMWTTGSKDKANPSLLAAGMRGPITGKRFDKVFLDDPTTELEARSAAIMDAQRRWLRNTLMSRFPPGKRITDDGTQGSMVVLLTRWSSYDLVPTLEELGFNIVRMPALGFWDAERDAVTGEWLYGSAPLWPELHSQADLLAARELDELSFELVMQGDEKAGTGGDTFDQANFQHGPLPADGWANVTVGVDTAGGKDRKRGDYTVLAAIGLQEDGVRDWVVAIDRARYTAPEQQRQVPLFAEQVANLCGRLDAVVVEDKGEGNSLYQHLVATTRLPLQPYTPGPGEDKEWRAIPLANAYRVLRMWHPDNAKWVTSYELELGAFPYGPHDDQVDAAALAYQATGKGGPRLRVLRTKG